MLERFIVFVLDMNKDVFYQDSSPMFSFSHPPPLRFLFLYLLIIFFPDHVPPAGFPREHQPSQQRKETQIVGFLWFCCGRRGSPRTNVASCSLTFIACYVIKHKTVGVISCFCADSLGSVMKLWSLNVQQASLQCYLIWIGSFPRMDVWLIKPKFKIS